MQTFKDGGVQISGVESPESGDKNRDWNSITRPGRFTRFEGKSVQRSGAVHGDDVGDCGCG
jgi:hypothetical protein